MVWVGMGESVLDGAARLGTRAGSQRDSNPTSISWRGFFDIRFGLQWAPGAAMTISAVGSKNTQSLARQLLQQLNATGTPSQTTQGLSGLAGDQVTLSPAAQRLSQAPAAVTQALSDLLVGKKAAPGDLAQLQGYLKADPEGLGSLLGEVQGSVTTAGAASADNSTDSLLTALVNHQSNFSNPSALLGLLGGDSNQKALLASLGKA